MRRDTYRGKVSTVSTLLMINNLSVYKSPYIFSKVSTSLGINNLSVYTNVKVIVAMIFTEGNGLYARLAAQSRCTKKNPGKIFRGG